MTLDRAQAAARIDAQDLGVAVAVYRFPAWPEGVYGVRQAARLPKEAVLAEVVAPPQGARPPEPQAPSGLLF